MNTKEKNLVAWKKGDKLQITSNEVGGGKKKIQVEFISLIPNENNFLALYKGHKFRVDIAKVDDFFSSPVEENEVIKTVSESINKLSSKEKKQTKTDRIISMLAKGISVKDINKVVENKYMARRLQDGFTDIENGMSFEDSAIKNTGLSARTMKKKFEKYTSLKNGK